MSKAHTDKRYILLRETYHGKHSLARKLVDLRCCVLTQYARLLVSRMSENRRCTAVSKEASAKGASELHFIGGDVIFKCSFLVD